MATQVMISCDKCMVLIGPKESKYKLKIEIKGFGTKEYDLCNDCAQKYWSSLQNIFGEKK